MYGAMHGTVKLREPPRIVMITYDFAKKRKEEKEKEKENGNKRDLSGGRNSGDDSILWTGQSLMGSCGSQTDMG
jgi:hypothetical protein